MKEIIVIGAGMAGLAAARQLQAHKKYKVTVLEARDRIGGRAWTDYSLGIPFDCGASLIHGLANNPLAKLAQTYHARFTNLTQRQYYLLDSNGKPIPADEQKANEEEFEHFLLAANQYALQASADMPLTTAFEHVAQQHMNALHVWKLRYLGLYAGTDAQNLSARYWDIADEYMSDVHLMLDGYAPIVNGLAHDLTIHLEKKVTDVIYDEKKVRVKTNSGDYSADAVIVTVPLGVLQKNKIRFTPELPPQKKAAMQRVQMGVINKIALKFSEQFWSKNHIVFSQCTTAANEFSFFVDYAHYFSQPILINLVAGNLAYDLEQFDDAATVEITMQKLRSILGTSIPDPIASFVTRWGQDPFSYGAYSFLPVNGSAADYLTLGEPVADYLYFAGEATTNKPATIHGAYLSGVREAERILALPI